MPYNPKIHNRHSIRLQNYDYSSEGAYFLTICTYQRRQIFGKIENGIMHLNQFGQIVRDEWEKSAIIRSEIKLGEYIIMPNHMHAIVFITPPRRGVRPNAPTMPNTATMPNAHTNPTTLKNMTKSQPLDSDPNAPCFKLHPKTIGALMSGFKSSVTKQINILRQAPAEPVWQRNYWDHIIREDDSLDQIESYILHNPENWHLDQLFIN